MMCSACHREKTQVKHKPVRDWFVLTTSVQFIIGLGLLWFGAWLLGRFLLSIPSDFHEGATWEKLTF